MKIFIGADIILLAGMLTFQVWNLWKYKDTNGAAVKRIVFLISTVALIIHCVKIWTGTSTGAFLLLHIAGLFFLFDMARLKDFWRWVRKK